MRRAVLPLLVALPLAAGAAEHPFILWPADEAAAIRKRVEGEPWAKAAFAKMVEGKDPLAGLFRIAVMGDTQPIESEKKELLRMARSPVPRGAAQYINVLRYDILYGQLTPEERLEVEDCFRVYIENHVFKRAIFDKSVFNDSRNYSRYDARKYTRSNWLPNIIWPWKVSANLMALALADEALLRRTWAAYGSWKWYFDDYLCDTGFYAEEFSKMGSTPGAMLVYCLGLRHLGLDELGFGYTGKGGATMRGHIESLFALGYPRIDLGSDRPQYPMVTMGDLRQAGSSRSTNLPGYAFQHSLVMGYLPNGTGGDERWRAHGAWGGTVRGNNPQWDGYTGFTPKMQIPFWFEIGHRLWPEAGFGYFLAQMRAPGQDSTIPSLYFGLDPIDPRQAKAPPAPSAVWPERGLAMLRADQSPAYWESEAPAVCMRLATSYAHSVNDSFALLGLYAFHRPIYLNRQTTRGYAQGWSRSVQSHCGVVVDGGEPRFTSETAIRKAFGPGVKFVAARSAKVYPDVDFTRALFLTREYLLDVAALASPRSRSCHWLVHALGQAQEKWGAAERIDGLSPEFKGVRRLDAGEGAWSVTVVQDCPVPDPQKTALGEGWYAKRIGVRLAMLGEAGTTAWLADTPQAESDPKKPSPPDEIGGTTIVASRIAASTAFVALHEPIEGAASRITDFRRIAQAEGGLAVAVVGRPGSGIDDRVLIRLGDEADKLLTLAGGGETFTFADHAYVRVGPDRVEVSGGLTALKLRVPGRPRLFINGKEHQAALDGSFLSFSSEEKP